MFRKVLIANRGEIAVRVIRACRDLGISPVVVYSEADRTSLHVRMADEACFIGPSSSSESYLVVEKILDAAQKTGSEAIHPGYGFLSENPALAQACADCGIKLVGPSADSMRLLGSKTGARETLQRCGIPVVPGTHEALKSVRQAILAAKQVGYPVMLKASAGGGGKGMRLIEDESQVDSAFKSATSEAKRAFGDSSVYLEKYIQRPRHIEIQVLADEHGNAVHLGERECSIQRRHQKVVEESPSPLVDEELRSRMGEVALQVVGAADYFNAGTVEFLVDQDRSFYFLEMNTRLQVEHPVTELVTGIDLVREQFRIASGARLALTQDKIALRGWALECRIYAEDPANNFFPSPGTISELAEPMGPGVRVDSGIYQGWEVPVHYDPLLSKLVTFGPDRDQAISRMQRALSEYRVGGIKTNLPFFMDVLSDASFLEGRLSTGFIDQLQPRLIETPGDGAETARRAAALSASIVYKGQSNARSSHHRQATASGWKSSGRPAARKLGWRL